MTLALIVHHYSILTPAHPQMKIIDVMAITLNGSGESEVIRIDPDTSVKEAVR